MIQRALKHDAFGRLAGPTICLVILAWVLASGSRFWIYNITQVAIYAIVVIGLNALVGFAGQVSFAQTAFMAIGGYGVGILSANHHWNAWLASAVSCVVAVAAASVIGSFLLRLRGHYLTMATFALAYGMYSYVGGATGLTGGAIGISGVPALAIGGLSFAQPVPMLVLCAGICLAAVLAVSLLGRSHIGRTWKAVAAREDVVSSLGISASRAKMLAFCIAALLGVVGGILYVEQTGFVSPDLYAPTTIINLFVMLFIGGRGRTFGPLLGAAVVVILPVELSGLANIEGIIFDLLLLAVILIRPQGLLGRAPAAAPVSGDSEKDSVAGSQDEWVDHEPARKRDASETYLQTRLVASGLSKRFGGVAALTDVDLQLDTAEVCGLIGPNGAGKSTLLSILSGAVAPDRGSVTIDSVPLAGRGRHVAARAGLVQTFQQASPIPGLTVRENVMLGLAVRKRPSVMAVLLRLPSARRAEAEAVARADAALRVFGLSEQADQDASGLSFGQLRLLEIARAFVTEPRLLLLDEPAAGLNQVEVTRLGTTIREMRDRGIGVLVVDHDVPFLFGICDRVVAMDYGKVIAAGSPDEVENDTRVRAAYLATEPAAGMAVEEAD